MQAGNSKMIKSDESEQKPIVTEEAGTASSQDQQVVSSPDDVPYPVERRATPHWSLVAAALILFALLLFLIKDYLSPLTLSIAMLILLYPSRRTRELKPFLLLVSLVVLISLWWRLHALITPFLIAFIVAYALNPVIEWLEKRRIPRLLVVFGIVGVILGAMVGIGILIVPRLIVESGELAANVPQWIETAWNWGLNTFIPWLLALDLPINKVLENIQDKLPGLFSNFLSKFANWSSAALIGAVGLISGLANLILIPILSVYFLYEFSKIRQTVYGLVPKRNQSIAHEVYTSLNIVLSAYIHGQLLVCTFLAVWIGMGLWLFAGIPYALLLGITAGLANLIPYVGTAAAGLLTLIIAVTQPDPLWTVIKAAIVFVTAQSLEGNLITPRIVGERVGLHPLIVIFVVLLFATLFGFIGMLIAIPVSASIKEVFLVWQRNKKKS